MDNLASILSHLMLEKNIGSAELARKTGISQPVIYRLMTGETENPQVLTLKPIADYFGISLDQLIGSPKNNPQQDITNKLATIKTISSVFVDTLPLLIEAYQKAVSKKLVNEDISVEVFPLLLLNGANLIKTINQLHELIIDAQDVL